MDKTSAPKNTQRETKKRLIEREVNEEPDHPVQKRACN